MATAWTYRCEYVKCGKRCSGCPHGPYWYRYRRGPKGKVEKEYLGKQDPREAEKIRAERQQREELPWWELMTNGRTANIDLANRILQLEPDQQGSYSYALIAYRRLCKEYHPDREGDGAKMTGLNAAWSYLKAFHGWKGRH